MADIPVIGFSAWSGTGKTTLIERIIRCLKAKGLRIAVIKHEGHEFDIDHEGKDSWRFAHAGADLTLITSATKTAAVEQRGYSLKEMLDRIENVDLILVEGFKHEPIPRIGICRKATGKGFPEPPETYLAAVTDIDEIPAGIPCFGLDDAEGIAAFIVGYFHLK